MICYFSCMEPNIFKLCPVDNVLVSYADILAGKRIKVIAKRMFLDSGAFSAWTSNIKVSIDDYISYIKSSPINWTAIASLDVIGNAEESFENWIKIRDAGIDTIPTFHTREDFKYLHEYCKMTDYIALGGFAVEKSRNSYLDSYLQKCFAIIYSYNKKIKVHGFGIGMNMDLLVKYPFYSTDSTSYVKAFGQFRIIPVAKYLFKKYSCNYEILRLRVKEKLSRNASVIIGINMQCEIADFVTKVWEKRGILWEE